MNTMWTANVFTWCQFWTKMSEWDPRRQSDWNIYILSYSGSQIAVKTTLNCFEMKNAIQATVQTQHMCLYKYEIVSIKYLYKM